ncbi:hypothetical protein LNP25_29235 [Klebsiella variicola subsp. variicola]|nr:hypothetical protein [Klebsiella variicola subsp. variicola]
MGIRQPSRKKQRRNKQQQKDMRIEIDLKSAGGWRSACSDLDQRQRHLNGQKMRHELRSRRWPS